MGLYSCGNIELWGYTAVGTELWGYTAGRTKTVELHSYGNTELSGYTAEGINTELLEHRAVGLYSCGNIELWT